MQERRIDCMNERAQLKILSGFIRSSVVAFAIWNLSSVPGRADYSLAAGDVLQMSAFGIPGFQQRIAIDLDGNAFFPLIGQVHVEGRTVADVRSQVGRLIATKDFRIFGDAGREVHTVVSPDEVILQVAEYRPIVVNGDVATPGSQPFRAGLTVREAVAIAGGYDLMHVKFDNPMIQAVDFKTGLQNLEIDLSREKLRLEGLKAELKGSQTLDDTAPVKAASAVAIKDLEVQRLMASLGDADAQRKYLNVVIEQTKAKLDGLEQQEQRESEGAKLDDEEATRSEDLYKRGLATSSKSTDARRVSLLSWTRYLETGVESAKTRKEHEDLKRQLAAFDATRVLSLLGSIQDSTAKVAGSRPSSPGPGRS